MRKILLLAVIFLTIAGVAGSNAKSSAQDVAQEMGPGPHLIVVQS